MSVFSAIVPILSYYEIPEELHHIVRNFLEIEEITKYKMLFEKSIINHAEYLIAYYRVPDNNINLIKKIRQNEIPDFLPSCGFRQRNQLTHCQVRNNILFSYLEIVSRPYRNIIAEYGIVIKYADVNVCLEYITLIRMHLVVNDPLIISQFHERLISQLHRKLENDNIDCAYIELSDYYPNQEGQYVIVEPFYGIQLMFCVENEKRYNFSDYSISL